MARERLRGDTHRTTTGSTTRSTTTPNVDVVEIIDSDSDSADGHTVATRRAKPSSSSSSSELTRRTTNRTNRNDLVAQEATTTPSTLQQTVTNRSMSVVRPQTDAQLLGTAVGKLVARAATTTTTTTTTTDSESVTGSQQYHDVPLDVDLADDDENAEDDAVETKDAAAKDVSMEFDYVDDYGGYADVSGGSMATESVKPQKKRTSFGNDFFDDNNDPSNANNTRDFFDDEDEFGDYDLADIDLLIESNYNNKNNNNMNDTNTNNIQRSNTINNINNNNKNNNVDDGNFEDFDGEDGDEFGDYDLGDVDLLIDNYKNQNSNNNNNRNSSNKHIVPIAVDVDLEADIDADIGDIGDDDDEYDDWFGQVDIDELTRAHAASSSVSIKTTNAQHFPNDSDSRRKAAYLLEDQRLSPLATFMPLDAMDSSLRSMIEAQFEQSSRSTGRIQEPPRSNSYGGRQRGAYSGRGAYNTGSGSGGGGGGDGVIDGLIDYDVSIDSGNGGYGGAPTGVAGLSRRRPRGGYGGRRGRRGARGGGGGGGGNVGWRPASQFNTGNSGGGQRNAPIPVARHNHYATEPAFTEVDVAAAHRWEGFSTDL